ncbi:MAG: hypothetical protein MMC33_002187 [Icmadophila ericetorum]|nr:hypothetical protein [Icmadophila ericetorum]
MSTCDVCSQQISNCSIDCYKQHKPIHSDINQEHKPSAPTIEASSISTVSVTGKDAPAPTSSLKDSFQSLLSSPTLQQLYLRYPLLKSQLQSVYAHTVERHDDSAPVGADEDDVGDYHPENEDGDGDSPDRSRSWRGRGRGRGRGYGRGRGRGGKRGGRERGRERAPWTQERGWKRAMREMQRVRDMPGVQGEGLREVGRLILKISEESVDSNVRANQRAGLEHG